ncbi:MAG: hypothetical protein AAF351_14645 [Pseudomonadota bacterium]
MDRRVTLALLALAVLGATAANYFVHIRPNQTVELEPTDETYSRETTESPIEIERPLVEEEPLDEPVTKADIEAIVAEHDLEYECSLRRTAYQRERDNLVEKIEDSAERLVPLLERSNNPDHRLAAVLLLTENYRQFGESLEQLLRDFPNYAPAANLALQECSHTGRLCEFVSQSKIERWPDLDQNAATWLAMARLRQLQGRNDEAIAAMRRAAAAPVFNGYVLERTRIMEQGLAVGGDLAGWQRVIGALEIVSNAAETENLEACVDDALQSDAWLQVCIQVAERVIEEPSAGLFQLTVGAQLAGFYARAGRTEDATKQERMLDEQMKVFSVLSDSLARAVYEQDDQVFFGMLDHWNESEKFFGIGYLNAEVQRKIDAGEYPPAPDCPEW